MKRSFHIAEGQVWHFGNIVAPGMYGDFFLPLRINGNPDLISNLKHERQLQLEGIGNDTIEVLPAHFKVENGQTLIRLKWKQQQIDDGHVVIVDKDNNPLNHTDRQLQDAIFKVSFYQQSWEFKGKCGTKLVPRKIQLQSLATIDDVLKDNTVEGEDIRGDF
jgi:hypothetical protein